MTKEEIIHLLETDYLNGIIDIKEVKEQLGYAPYYSSEFVFKDLGIYDEFKKIQNKRRGLSTKKTNLLLYGTGNGHKRIKPERDLSNPIYCLVCNEPVVNKKGMGLHIKRKHNLSAKEYYDTYIKQDGEGICPTCGKKTPFRRLFTGYSKYCSNKCIQHPPVKGRKWSHPMSEEAKKKCGDALKKYSQEHFNTDNPFQAEEIKEKSKQTCKQKYNCDYAMQNPDIRNDKLATEHKAEKIQQLCLQNNWVTKEYLVEQFGWGWYQAKIVEPISNSLEYGSIANFYSKEVIPIIEEYYEIHLHNQRSYAEYELTEYIKSFYNKDIITGSRSIIPPQELDIYLPDLQLAIEFNGVRFHSIELDTPKNYHLHKSLVCREKGIRLVHIYEFEDINKQKQLLKDLILGHDNYPKEDFNKNNLINNIPQPEIIYSDKYTIYGAGKLY